jgi:hypothetical protein
MRLSGLLVATIYVCPAAADWIEYTPPDRAFTVHFPSEPNVQTTDYQAPDGRSYSARVYSVLEATGAFKLTVADIPETGNQVREDDLMNDAVKKTIDDGQVKFDIQHRVRWFYGRQLGIGGANGGYTYVAVFHHNNRLYQIEGKAFVAGGQAEVDAMRFQQSLDFP